MVKFSSWRERGTFGSAVRRKTIRKTELRRNSSRMSFNVRDEVTNPGWGRNLNTTTLRRRYSGSSCTIVVAAVVMLVAVVVVVIIEAFFDAHDDV